MKTIEPTLQHTFSHDTIPGAALKVGDLDFYNLLRRQADESRLFFNQRRAVIFDVEAIGTLRQQLIESLGIELAAGVLTRFGYTQGQGDADMLAQNFDWETDMDWLAAGPSLHMLEGVVHVQPEFIEFNRETGHFHMHGSWLNSYEAEEHLKRFGVSTQPVCWTLTGYASGYGTRFFGRELLAVETECVGKGDARCYWEIRPLEAWGVEAEPYRQALKKIDISSQLVETNRQLQKQIIERKQAEEKLAKRATELEIITRVSTAAATILQTDELLQEVVDLTKRNLGLYHAHIYLLNTSPIPPLQGGGQGEVLVLAAGAGEVGQQMVANGWAIPLDHEHSLVAQAARTRQAVIVNDVRLNPDFLPNPLLPKTRSEMAIPLMVGDNVLGVLDVQAEVVNRFTQEDASIKTILAGQIAATLENARLFEQTQARARREQILREVTARVRSSVDADTIMRVAVQEVGKALGRPAFVYLGQGDKQPDQAEKGVRGSKK